MQSCGPVVVTLPRRPILSSGPGYLLGRRARCQQAYTLILANPPFAGSLDYEGTAKDLLQVVKTKKT